MLALALQTLVILLKLCSLYHQWQTHTECDAPLVNTITVLPHKRLVLGLCSPDHQYYGPTKLSKHIGLKPGYTLINITLSVLLLSGDIELNPCPHHKSLYPCGYCELPVNWSHRAICCDKCTIWYHKSCADLSTQEFDLYEDNQGILESGATTVTLECTHLTLLCLRLKIPSQSSPAAQTTRPPQTLFSHRGGTVAHSSRSGFANQPWGITLHPLMPADQRYQALTLHVLIWTAPGPLPIATSLSSGPSTPATSTSCGNSCTISAKKSNWRTLIANCNGCR